MKGRVVVASWWLAAIFCVAGRAAAQQVGGFNHATHAKLFVSCTLCHAGATQSGAALFPAATACATCHDGNVVRAIRWQPRTGPRVSNLKFDHSLHASQRRARGDTASARCADCHAATGAGWMQQIHAPSAPQCVSCHTQGRGVHVDLPDTACTTCHLTLAQATTFSEARIAKFPAPSSHKLTNFMTTSGHGALAKKSSGGSGGAQSCATCHARDFCASCHVNAPETAVIRALAPDPRSLALPHLLKAPASHAASGFEATHGKQAGSDGASCRTCHTQESCLTCHRAAVPGPVRFLAVAGPGRGKGAVTVARLPSSHSPTWRTQHGPVAAASMRSCNSCHQRQECLTCHVPNSASKGSYHPPAYLTRHPADAYSRANSCADCHNTGEFCQTCHNQSGLTVKRGLIGPAGYHDGNRQFFLGHGKAARQGLESCVSCHVERDCLTCHSVIKGRSFNPHGPGFNAELMLKKNPQLCIACHGTSIPRTKVGG